MKKIINYVINGQGVGARWLLLFTVITVLAATIYLRLAATSLIPYAQDVANQMLPIKISDGIVVEPHDTFKSANIQSGSYSLALPLVIDTRVDTLNTANLKDGVYLTRTTLYTVNKNEVKILKLTNDLDIPQADYTDFFTSVLNWGAFFGALFGWAFMFVFYFILSLFYSWCAVAVAKVAGRQYDFDQRMRLSVLSLMAAYLLSWVLGHVGLSSGMLAFFLIVIIFEGLLISRLPAQTIIKKTVQETGEDKTVAVQIEEKQKEVRPVVSEKPATKTKAKTMSAKKTTAKTTDNPVKKAPKAKSKAPVKKKTQTSQKKTDK